MKITLPVSTTRTLKPLSLIFSLLLFTTIIQAQVAFTVHLKGVHASCDYFCDGSIESVIGGGHPPYQYLWSSGQTTANITGLCQGEYQLTVEDSTGATTRAKFRVNTLGELSVRTVLVQGDSGVCDGEVDLSVLNGVAPYLYDWDHGGTTSNETGLCAQTYTVNVIDDMGCRTKFNVYVPSVAPIAAPATFAASSIVSPVAAPVSNGSAQAAQPQPVLSHTAYPNPFTTKATVAITTDTDLNSFIALYDFSGNMIYELHNGNLQANKWYDLSFSADDLQKGWYIYKIESGNRVETGKLYKE